MSKKQQKIGLAKSVSLDEEEIDETTSMEAETFLESYEEMLRQQKEELEVTLRHLEPLLELLESKRNMSSRSTASNQAGLFTREFSYASLKQALQEIEDDDSLRFVAADLQWKLVLQLLTENVISDEDTISWAEIVMCYRTCIIGMQTLDQTPDQNELRNRVRHRSLHMLSSFRADGAKSNGSSLTKPRRSSVFESVEMLFIVGSLVLLGAVTFSGVMNGVGVTSSGSTGTSIDTYYQMPLIPGPHVEPFSTEQMIIPGPHVRPNVEMFLIPGPAVPPFYVADVEVNSQPTTLPPVSVRDYSEQELSRTAIPPLGGPLQSRKRRLAPSQGNFARNEEAVRFLQRAPKQGTNLNKNALTVGAAAGATLVAGALTPIRASLAAALGTTLPGLLPIGATVIFSTLLAHGIHNWLGSVLAKFRRAREN